MTNTIARELLTSNRILQKIITTKAELNFLKGEEEALEFQINFEDTKMKRLINNWSGSDNQ